VFYLQDLLQLLGAPRAMQPALSKDQLLHRLIGTLRKAVWPVTARRQGLEPALGVTRQMFMPGFTADTELFAQIAQREPVGLGQYNESIEFFHLGYFVPGHRALMCNPSLRIKCYLSRRIEPAIASLSQRIRPALITNTTTARQLGRKLRPHLG